MNTVKVTPVTNRNLPVLFILFTIPVHKNIGEGRHDYDRGHGKQNPIGTGKNMRWKTVGFVIFHTIDEHGGKERH